MISDGSGELRNQRTDLPELCSRDMYLGGAESLPVFSCALATKGKNVSY